MLSCCVNFPRPGRRLFDVCSMKGRNVGWGHTSKPEVLEGCSKMNFSELAELSSRNGGATAAPKPFSARAGGQDCSSLHKPLQRNVGLDMIMTELCWFAPSNMLGTQETSGALRGPHGSTRTQRNPGAQGAPDLGPLI